MRTVAGTRTLETKRYAPRRPGEKWCAKCKTYKPRTLEHFTRGKGWAGYCRACQTSVSKHYQGDKAQRIRELKDGQPCMDCHEPFPFYVLDYDHRPGEVKQFEIGKAARGTWAWKTILAEIAKCDLICANCHRKRTWQRATQNAHSS